MTLPPGQRVAVEFIAIDESGRQLPVALARVGKNGALSPRPGRPIADGSRVFLLGPGTYAATAVAAAGTSYHLYGSLAGDVNGDHEVDAFDLALLDEEIITAAQGTLQTAGPSGASRRLLRSQEHFARFNQRASVAIPRHDLDLGVSLVYEFEPSAEIKRRGRKADQAAVLQGTWQFNVGGLTFTMKGITGDYGYADMSEWSYTYLNSYFSPSGANTLRTYGLNDTKQLVTNTSAALAWAASQSTATKPVMVLVGLYIPGVATSALETAIDQIVADSNASHILAWCVGNETPTSDYAQINTVAAYIKTKSTAPVTTAVPNVTTGALQSINTAIPNLDFLGINSFYGQFDASHVQGIFLGELDGTMSSAKTSGIWTKPWAVTEYYTYDLPSAGFGNYAGMPSQTINNYRYFLELNSTLNAQNYATSWSRYIASRLSNGNLGGGALNWMPPHNSQVPAFWKDMFVYNGQFEIFVNWYQKYGVSRLQAVDAVSAAYGGVAPAVPTPQVVLPADGDPQGIASDWKPTLTSPGRQVGLTETLTATAAAFSTDALTFDWYLIGGTAVIPNGGGITRASTDTFMAYGASPVTSILIGNGTTTGSSGTQSNTISFQLPSGTPTGNNYQLRVVIHDLHGGAATAAVALWT
jgi:hypothetical protein